MTPHHRTARFALALLWLFLGLGCPGGDDDAADDDTSSDDDTGDDDGSDDDSSAADDDVGDDDAELASGSLVGLPGSRAGESIAVCDVDHDGADDVVVGLPMDDTDGVHAGSVRAVFGPVSGMTLLEHSDLSIHGIASSQQVGGRVGCGDIDADGFVDLVTGIDGHTTDEKIYVYLGPLSGELQASAFDGAIVYPTGGQHELVAVADLDGDAHDDIVTFDQDRIHVHLGPITETVSAKDAAATISADGAHWYFSPGPVCDLDGDGTSDLIARLTEWPSKWPQELGYLGPFSGDLTHQDADVIRTWSIPDGDDYYSQSSCGELSGDTFDDLIAGYPGGINTDAPESYVFVEHGPLTPGSAAIGQDALVYNDIDDAQVLFTGGDVTGDGIGDLLVRFHLIPGPLSGDLSLSKFSIDIDVLPHDAVLGRDVDGDGIGDLVVSVPSGSSNGADSGIVWVYSGALIGDVRESK